MSCPKKIGELEVGAVPYKSSTETQTGDWGVAKPKIDAKKCTRCTLCHFFCPEGAIRAGEGGEVAVDEAHCKGCGVCAEECPAKCITMEAKK